MYMRLKFEKVVGGAAGFLNFDEKSVGVVLLLYLYKNISFAFGH
jgi:hypothetical protein